MSATVEHPQPQVGRFRIRLLLAMMLVVVVMTSLGIYLAERSAAADAEANFQRDFKAEIGSLHRLQDLRDAAVVDRSTKLAGNARIHAALEDNALDLLYPSAKEELRDLMESPEQDENSPADALHAHFYRFLNEHGAVLPPPTSEPGRLSPNEEAQLAQAGLPETLQRGYFVRVTDPTGPAVDEIVTVPIRSTETNKVIAALVLGFKPVATVGRSTASGMQSGILTGGELHLPALDKSVTAQLATEVTNALERPREDGHSLKVSINNSPHLLFFKRLNPNSTYPPAYEVSVYPLRRLITRQRQLRLEILGAGGLLLLGGLVVSAFFSRRLSQPVEELAVASERNLVQRRRAEEKLQVTSEELERSARFSADASHQLKSPITVLRAGLDSLLMRQGFPPEVYEEISSLIHQTYRLTGVVEDLLLLSRMDAGHVRLKLRPVDLSMLVAEWVDDLRAMPDGVDLNVETDIPPDIQVIGEPRYTTLVVQNLLDNARKYNHPGGRISISAHQIDDKVVLRVGNTGRGIPREAQPYIFERFQRGNGGGEVPGHGLGLNLARELVRLHDGELRLVRSDGEWTEFSVTFVAAAQPAKLVEAAG